MRVPPADEKGWNLSRTDVRPDCPSVASAAGDLNCGGFLDRVLANYNECNSNA
jgi:hypothetical protein